MLTVNTNCFLFRGLAWSSEVLVRNNDAHPWVECSNRGECDRDTGYVLFCCVSVRSFRNA